MRIKYVVLLYKSPWAIQDNPRFVHRVGRGKYGYTACSLLKQLVAAWTRKPEKVTCPWCLDRHYASTVVMESKLRRV